ncbi:hypothetical protein [Antrihabitans cavernicola]|uniref:Uncharacterized protein n=1 Tax=Antrihabitans cavernicola TaxID=2495913 RepID=A0A5A7SI53_9NOCA|nr:hypothetical protein [Spelaeibacter cavernicola]KAA0024283.1 hypothetical protein FOY51_07045 [Spelaeibacter cavernicola]
MAELSHELFARRVLAAAMPSDRVSEVIGRVIGTSIVIGPLRAGPGGVAAVTAVGVPGPVAAEESSDPDWALRIQVPIRLSVHVVLAGRTARYLIDVVVRTRLRQQLEEPCTVVIDVEPVHKRDVYSRTAPKGAPARLVGWIGNINSEVAERVVQYINELIDSPRVATLRRIDVAALLGRAWAAGLVVDVPQRVAPVSEVGRRNTENHAQSRDPFLRA